MTAKHLNLFMAKVIRDLGSGCWLWNGSTDGHGYGQVNWPSVWPSPLKAHRVSYEHFVGPIQDGLTLDHLCRNRRCVNPLHLEAVTGAENTRRGLTLADACRRGHPRTEENVYIEPDGTRQCRACRNLRRRKDNAAAQRTRCPHGHEYTPENTYVKPSTGHRECRLCIRERSKRLVEKRRLKRVQVAA